MVQQSSRGVVFRTGLIFGVVGGVLSVLGTVLGKFVQSPAAASAAVILGIVLFVVGLAIYFLAGMFTARQTGTVGSAAIAGLITGVVGSLFGAAATTVTTLSDTTAYVNTIIAANPSAAATYNDPNTRNSLILVPIVLGFICGPLIGGGIGAGLGALGGLVGRGQAPRPAEQAYQEQYYQGMSASPTPGYPPQQPGFPTTPPTGEPGNFPPPPPTSPQ